MDRLRARGYANNLSAHAQPIRVPAAYPRERYLSISTGSSVLSPAVRRAPRRDRDVGPFAVPVAGPSLSRRTRTCSGFGCRGRGSSRVTREQLRTIARMLSSLIAARLSAIRRAISSLTSCASLQTPVSESPMAWLRIALPIQEIRPPE